MRKIAFDPKKETAVASGGGDCILKHTYNYVIYGTIYTCIYIHILIYLI